jgi:acetyl-CoA C-acetyltransferase
MLDGTIPAIQKALHRADLKADDIDLWEVNEAFASVPIATRDTIGFEDSKLNVSGGAIALGHPLGMSGARLITTMLHEMERQNLRRGLAALCIGFGMGVATIIERPH